MLCRSVYPPSPLHGSAYWLLMMWGDDVIFLGGSPRGEGEVGGRGHQHTYAFLRLDWCTGGWHICVDLDFQTCCQFPAAVMECESSIFK